MRPLSDEALAFFASPAGRKALASLEDVPEGLSGATQLRGAGYSADQAGWLQDQAKLRRRAERKFGPEAARLLLTREALEQASARPVAEWRSRRLASVLSPGARVLEVGAATGGDTLALARAGLRVVACELDPIRAGLLRWNVEALGLSEQVEVVEGDATLQSWTGLDAVYADPARRREGRRSLGLEAGSPPLSVLRAIGCQDLLVKAAPGLDPSEVPDALGLTFVSLRRELKEGLLAAGGCSRASPGRDGPGSSRRAVKLLRSCAGRASSRLAPRRPAPSCSTPTRP